jgi:hypothetical protein
VARSAGVVFRHPPFAIRHVFLMDRINRINRIQTELRLPTFEPLTASLIIIIMMMMALRQRTHA